MLEIRNVNGEPANRLPDVDIHEENGELILRAEVPGLTLGSLGLTLDHGDLILDADGWDDSQVGEEHYEHLHGRLPLPFGIDAARVNGKTHGETLEVHIPLPPIPDGEEWVLLDELAY
ncbi:MAG: hypothetical protein ACJ75H_11415 [Thermoanaerobaculia bacterium]